MLLLFQLSGIKCPITFHWPFKGGASFVDPFCYLCLESVMTSYLFITALWSPAGNELISWLLCMWCFHVFCYFPMQCSGSGVVLDCIDSWYLPSSLLHIVYIILQCYIGLPVYYIENSWTIKHCACYVTPSCFLQRLLTRIDLAVPILISPLSVNQSQGISISYYEFACKSNTLW